MAQWQPKVFAEMTGISVRTLHHYDEIGLLKPSLRLPNGYRIYSQIDLQKLQQIVALKFFGFKLAEIKKLISMQTVQEHFAKQRETLRKKMKHLEQVDTMLNEIMQYSKQHASVDWKHTINLIKVYNMTQKLNDSWVGEVYNEEQVKQFAELKTKYTKQEIKDYQQKWQNLFVEIEKHLDKDPKTEIGKRYAKKWLTLLNSVYGDYPDLKKASQEAYEDGKIPGCECSKEVMNWIGRAFECHQIDKIKNCEK